MISKEPRGGQETFDEEVKGKSRAVAPGTPDSRLERRGHLSENRVQEVKPATEKERDPEDII